MFYVQSCFGLGATIAPFISTAFAQHVTERAYLYYIVAMAVALITAVVLVLVFELRTEEQVVGNADKAQRSEPAINYEKKGGDCTGDAGQDDIERAAELHAETATGKPIARSSLYNGEFRHNL